MAANNTIKILSPMMETIRKEMEKQISQGVIIAINEILQDISTTYNINLEDLKKKYEDKLVFVDNAHVIKPKKPRNISSDEQCMARTSLQSQCTRKRQNNHEYCGSHIAKQPHGRIDQPVIIPVADAIPATQPKKRGRPKGSTKKKLNMNSIFQPSVSDLIAQDDEDDMVSIELTEVDYDGVTYAMHQNNVYKKTADKLEDMDLSQMILLGKYDDNDQSIDFFTKTKIINLTA